MNDYRDSLILIKTEEVKDSIGNVEEIEVSRTETFCAVQSITRNEFYQAAQADMRPEIRFVIHPDEYSDEKLVDYNKAQYTVIRTYFINYEEFELICERKIKNAK